MTERADQVHHDNAPAHSTALMHAFLAKHHITQVCQPPYSPNLAPCNFWLFPKIKSPLKGRRFFECDSHTVHKLGQQHLTANWLAPRESDCSRMHSKVSSDWLPSHIKAMRLVLKIFKMAGYFPDSPHNWLPSLQPACIRGPHHQTTHCDHKQGKYKFIWNFATNVQDSTMSELTVLQHEQTWRIRWI
jgi:transposase